MRKNLAVKAHSLYITLFLFAATVAQAAPRTIDPEAITWWQLARQSFVVLRRTFDVIKFPIG